VIAGAIARAKVRWTILALFFSSTGLNYIDRQTLSISATTIQGAGTTWR
jgi:hypothetical protein